MTDWKYRELKSYHAAWLSAHPDLTKEWLWQKLREGFDVHHLDGDHSNDDPLNLILIYHPDHMMLHSGVRFCFKGRMRSSKKPLVVVEIKPRLRKERKTKQEPPLPTLNKNRGKHPSWFDFELGKVVYELYELGQTTGRIGQELNKGIFEVSQAAQGYAEQHGLIWPPKEKIPDTPTTGPSWDQFGKKRVPVWKLALQTAKIPSQIELERSAQIERNSPWLANFRR
jgi:hypothetical protein